MYFSGRPDILRIAVYKLGLHAKLGSNALDMSKDINMENSQTMHQYHGLLKEVDI